MISPGNATVVIKGRRTVHKGLVPWTRNLMHVGLDNGHGILTFLAFLQALQIGAGELKAGGKPVKDWHTSRVGKEILLKWSLTIDTTVHVSTNLMD